jgi:pimeloyl-ACP methyl ester carboxylesterase
MIKMKRKNDKIKILTILLFIAINCYCIGQIDFMVINGKKVEVLTVGLEHNQANKPVIVLENGRGSTFDSWEKVINEVTKESAVFAYNRPRIGNSEDDSIPPTMKHIVDNLRAMLKEKRLNPPYLLVGHSFGACYIRSFASYYPDEIAGLVFVDPHDFTKKKGFGRLPYQAIGLNEHQIDSIFVSYDMYFEQFLVRAPRSHVEEAKIQGELSETGHEECNLKPLPDVPVHFIMAGGFTLYPDETPTIYDREEMFRIDSNIKMKRWLELLYPLTYGRLFYSSNSGHAIQVDDPELVIGSIRLALIDYEKSKSE